MTILLTGANGFIGRHLYNRLQLGHTVIRVVRPDSQSSGTDIAIDLADKKIVDSVFSDGGAGDRQIDLIIHGAALLGGEGGYQDMHVFYKNIAMTENVIAIAQRAKVKKLVHLSTIGVYPNISGTYSEESAVNPGVNAECLYSLSKLCSEQLFAFFLKDIESVNLRLAQTYGEGMRDDRIYAIFLSELRANNTITVWGNGERASNFMSVDYCVETISRVVNKTGMTGTYNLGEQNISYLELAKSIVSQYGNATSEIIIKEQGAKSKVAIDSSKLIKALEHE